MKSTSTIKEWESMLPLHHKVRTVLRDLALRGLVVGRKISSSSNWIRFPYYHHVFEDECKNFECQLRYLSGQGQFISIDDVVALLKSQQPIDGRYFCLTFDDGLKCCLTHAAPILIDMQIPATFYVVTSLIGKSLSPNDRIARNTFGFMGKNTTMDFLTWDDCRLLLENGMTIGSHTQNHPRLFQVDEKTIIRELSDSKLVIEKELDKECGHFCVPYGIPGRDFDLISVGEIAQSLGYKSLVTGIRGSTRVGADRFALNRDHLVASWGNHQLRYFFS